ncbi:MAG: hypothetical protein J6Z14_08595 [Prevotella sp.]|nr:hypothetical protein [Prevotella sp.]
MFQPSIRKIVLTFAVFTAMTATADSREASVHGTSELVLDFNYNVTLREAKEECILMAKNDAIAKEFGELVTSDVVETMSESDGETTKSDYMESHEMKARGVWLRETKPTKFDVDYFDGKLVLKAEVWGKAREIKQSKVELKWKIMKDGNGKRMATQMFYDYPNKKDKEKIYVTFKAPTDGYVAIYLTQWSADVTDCLLPYRKNTSGLHEVKGGKEYTFFDKSFDPQANSISLTADNGDKDKYQMVIIFSPNKFYRPADIEVKGKNQVLNSSNFQKWLLTQQRDEDMVVEKKFVTVMKPKD